MRGALSGAVLACSVVALPATVSFGKGWWDALTGAPSLAARAAGLIAAGRGPDDPGSGPFAAFLRVQGPSVFEHQGVGPSMPGAGITTMTRSLAERPAFEEVRPGPARIRRTGRARGLERDLAQPQIAALRLGTVEMGRRADGRTTGAFEAAAARGAEPDARGFDGPPAVLIAPARPTREEGAARIARLLADAGAPGGHGDVRLEGRA